MRRLPPLLLLALSSCGHPGPSSHDLRMALDAGADFAVSERPDLAQPDDLTPADDLAGPKVLGFSAATSYAMPGIIGFALAAGDLNGDGRPDLVAGGLTQNAHNIEVFLNGGNGAFKAAVLYPVSGPIFTLALRDVNGDKRLDIVATATMNGNLEILLGNGNGTFQAQPPVPTTLYPYGVALDDLDGDGKIDAVIACTDGQGTSEVNVLLGNGNATFQPPKRFPAGSWPESIALADLDSDGKIDAIAGNWMGNSVSALLGNGDGTLQAPVDVAVGTNPRALAVADWNGDKRADVATANGGLQGGNGVNLLLGKGDGTFQATIAAAQGPAYVAAAGDFDGDGKLDLAFSYGDVNGPCVLVQTGHGDGTFAPPIRLEDPDFPYAVVVADFDADGKPDVAASNAMQTLVVFRNTTP